MGKLLCRIYPQNFMTVLKMCCTLLYTFLKFTPVLKTVKNRLDYRMKNSHDFAKWEARSNSTVDKVNLIAKILLYVVSLLKLSPDLLNTISKEEKDFKNP